MIRPTLTCLSFAHTSAGVGRTGTYITLDAMLDMAAAEERVNIFQFVSQMRERRIKMVQVVVSTLLIIS